jgi:DNA helicase-2/ATP-dependent DNA helicase PcrA
MQAGDARNSYRSHPDIIEVYNRWMEGQEWEYDGKRFRFDKTILPREDDFTDVPAALRLSAKPNGDWRKEVLAFLYRLRDGGTLTDWNQVAFLFRSVKGDRYHGELPRSERNRFITRSNWFMDRRDPVDRPLIFFGLMFLKGRHVTSTSGIITINAALAHS